MNNKKKCFAIMPFSKAYSLTKEQWTEVFEHKIKSAVEESGFGYECERYELRRANITKAILQEINSAHLVIADLTGKNPNVLWELGVRHTLSKRTILIAQDKKFLPSDLRDYPIILYKYKQSPAEVDKFKEDIKKELEDIEADPEKPDSPISDFLQLKNIDLLSYEKFANLKKLDALISELSYNLDTLDKIAKDLRTISTTHCIMQNTCMKLFLSTRYITPTAKILNDIFLCNYMVDVTTRFLSFIEERTSSKKQTEKIAKDLIVPMKGNFTSLLKSVVKVRTDYANDNYQEPKEPIILLSSPEHKEYLNLTEQAT